MFARLPFILMLLAIVAQTFIGSFRAGSVVCLGVPAAPAGDAPISCDAGCGHDERAPAAPPPGDEHDDACPCTDIDLQGVEAATPSRDALAGVLTSIGSDVAITFEAGFSMGAVWRGPPPLSALGVATRQRLSVVRATRLII